MAVRAFTTSDVLDCSTGALATSTFGTFAIIVKRAATGAWHTFLAMHNSGGSALNQFAYESGNTSAIWIDGTTVTGPAAIGTTAWGLVVVRKATGTATPRFSLYNFSTATWTHGNASGTRPNWTAPGASGTLRFRWETFDQLAGRVAVRAAWNTVPWSADTTGDAAIAAAGLHTSLQNWVNATPSALWAFNQDAVTTAVTDLTGNGANQSARTGTTVITGDDPPGFSFGGGDTSLALPVASETDTAVTAGRAKARAVAVAAESSAAQPIGRAKTLMAAPAAETANARPLERAKAAGLNPGAETCGAQPLGLHKVLALDTATENDATQLIGQTKQAALLTATETTNAQPLGMAKAATLTAAAEIDAALPILSPTVLAAALETDTAVPLGRHKALALGPAIEIDNAQLAGAAKVGMLSPSVEVATAAAVGAGKARALGAAAEIDTARVLTGPVLAIWPPPVDQPVADPIVDVAEPGAVQIVGVGPAVTVPIVHVTP